MNSQITKIYRFKTTHLSSLQSSRVVCKFRQSRKWSGPQTLATPSRCLSRASGRDLRSQMPLGDTPVSARCVSYGFLKCTPKLIVAISVVCPCPIPKDGWSADAWLLPSSSFTLRASTRRSQGHSNNNTPNDRLSRSSSLNSVPEISIEPPVCYFLSFWLQPVTHSLVLKSRPQSNSSCEALNSGSNLLSPAYADRPVPLPTAPAPHSSSRGPAASTPATGATIP